jgi:hypothetical protein
MRARGLAGGFQKGSKWLAQEAAKEASQSQRQGLPRGFHQASSSLGGGFQEGGFQEAGVHPGGFQDAPKRLPGGLG